MANRTRAVVGGALCAALACAGCASEREEHVAPAQSRVTSSIPGFVPGGKYSYVFGYSDETGQILGSTHLLMIPSTSGREPMDSANLASSLHPDLTGPYLLINSSSRRGASEWSAFAGSWWPQIRNGIADRWNSVVMNYSDRFSDPDNLSPAEKYDLLFYPGQTQWIQGVTNWTLEDAKLPPFRRRPPHMQRPVVIAGPTTAWEMQNHGLYQRVYPDTWWGHCNGWSSYATAEPLGAPARDIRVKLVGNTVTECGPQELGCVLFHMADIEALMSELYFNDSATLSGRRCETQANSIARDQYGRPTDPACRDLNPGTFHIAITGLMGTGVKPLSGDTTHQHRIPLVIDHSMDWEVWGYPVVQFSMDSMDEVSGARAMQLICDGWSGGSCSSYQFDSNATRFVVVGMRYWMVSDSVTGAELLKPALSRSTPLSLGELHYVLELDGAGTILGGEWIRDPAVRGGTNSKALHPDFMWIPIRPQGDGEDEDDLGGTGDNPYIAYSKVKALLTIAKQGGT